jgi:hypothetical protein
MLSAVIGGRPRVWFYLVLAGCAGCSRGGGLRPGATVTGEKDVGPAPTTQPGTVYVTDFDLELPADPRSGQSPGLLGHRSGPGGRILDRLRHEPGSTEERAARLLTLLSTSLVSDLQNAGIPAHHLAPSEPRPSDGWLLRGVVTYLEEGDRIRRAVVGFGAGATELDVYACLADLARDGDKPFYTVDTSATSGNMPGAVITMNPYAAAAKYKMSRNASEKDVEHTARKIAEEVVKRIKATPKP